MFNIGPLELMVILVIALLVVGPRRLPEVGRSIGRGIREFRKAQDEVQKTIQSALNEPASTARSVPRAHAAPRPKGSSVTDGTEATDAADAADATDDTEGTEVARHVGKGLAELRKARDEIHRSLRVDLDDEGDGGRSTAG
ncbi:MAG TPA: twin-arginine translocase TatA/TatE family subunit [Actinomycetota bacterium]|nr:twin-arginine translocase TatA/TatE family subunit [Actinomycetota bacterium]